MLFALPRLGVLDVSCNPQLTQEVDADGFRALAASLSHATSLATLRLQACGLTADSLDALGKQTLALEFMFLRYLKASLVLRHAWETVVT